MRCCCVSRVSFASRHQSGPLCFLLESLSRATSYATYLHLCAFTLACLLTPPPFSCSAAVQSQETFPWSWKFESGFPLLTNFTVQQTTPWPDACSCDSHNNGSKSDNMGTEGLPPRRCAILQPVRLCFKKKLWNRKLVTVTAVSVQATEIMYLCRLHRQMLPLCLAVESLGRLCNVTLYGTSSHCILWITCQYIKHDLFLKKIKKMKIFFSFFFTLKLPFLSLILGIIAVSSNISH